MHLHRSLLALIIALSFTSHALAATGGVTCTVRDGPSGTGLPQSAGSNVDDYTQTSLDLHRVGTSYIFTDASVNVGSGYVITGYATDYVPSTANNVTVVSGVTTTVNFYIYRPVLSLSISPTSFSENGGSATATITLKDGGGNTVTLRNDLALTASSGNTSKATVSQPATITAGNSTATFTVTGVDNAIVDSDTVVTITVSAAWGSGHADVTVVNDD